MIWLENNTNDSDRTFSDVKKILSNENRSANHLNSMYSYTDGPVRLCVNELNDRDYDYIPRSDLQERLKGLGSHKGSDTSRSPVGEHSFSMLSCSPEKTNVSVYENLAQNRTDINSFPTDSRDTSSESGQSTKCEESKAKMIGMYIVEKTIGKGNFSVVKLATHKLTQVKVAIKIIDKTRLSSENLQKIHREVGIMKLLHHPNIVKLYQVLESDSMIYIVMEFVPNGEIFDFIANRGRFKEEEARTIFYQIVCAIEYCHTRHIVHRDLKAENLLLDDKMNIKLADFGFGNFWQDGLSLSTFCGSPPYAAPEIFKGEKYSGPKADIWSLGVVLYVLVSGSLPFEERTLGLLKERVVQAKYRIPFWMSDDCEDLIKNMLCRVPDRRYSVRQILDHRWLRRAADLGRCALTPCLADDMRKGIFNEQIVSVMQQKGMSRKQIIESLSTCAYDHRTALYLLLGEKMRRRARGSMPEDNLGAPPASLMQRRPSSVAESLMMNRGGIPRELQTWLGQYQQQQQQPQPPQQQQSQQQQLLGSSYTGNVIDVMQTDVPIPQPAHNQNNHHQAPAQGTNASQLSMQLQSMAISPFHSQPPPLQQQQQQTSERRHAMTICLDVTQPPPATQHHPQQQHRPSPPGSGPLAYSEPPRLYYTHHHHQFDNGACCLSSSASSASSSPTARHTPPVRHHHHHHHHHHGHHHHHHHHHRAHLRHSPVAAPPPSSAGHHSAHHHHGVHAHHLLPRPQQPAATQQHLHPAWAPSTSYPQPVRPTPAALGVGPGPELSGAAAAMASAVGGTSAAAPPSMVVPSNAFLSAATGGHRFNEGRRASDVGVIGGLTPVAMETQFAPLRAAARAGGMLDLVPTSEEEEVAVGIGDEDEELPAAVSGLETVEFVHASQLPTTGLHSPAHQVRRSYSPGDDEAHAGRFLMPLGGAAAAPLLTVHHHPPGPPPPPLGLLAGPMHHHGLHQHHQHLLQQHQPQPEMSVAAYQSPPGLYSPGALQHNPGKRFSLPVACVHSAMDEGSDETAPPTAVPVPGAAATAAAAAGSASASGPGGEEVPGGGAFIGPGSWGAGRRAGCQLPTIVSAAMDEECIGACLEED